MMEKLLLKPEDLKPSMKNWTIDGVLNPSAIRRKDGKIVLYVRVAERSPQHRTMITCPIISGSSRVIKEKYEKEKLKIEVGNVVYFKDSTCRLTNLSHFREVILSEDGYEIENIRQRPFFTGLPKDGDYGVEDPRVTKIKNKYLMTYVSVNLRESVCTSLAVSKNLRDWERKGIIFRTQNKDVVLFPEKINGRFVALHRPEGHFEFDKPSIWISHSPDLRYWGDERVIIQPRKNAWDSIRIGAGSPPIKTEAGWLEIYHGVHDVLAEEEQKSVYCAGAILLDLKHPEKVLARSPPDKPLIKPERDYEKRGFLNNIIFPTGIVQDLNPEYVLLYSGAADKFISVKKLKVENILNSMEHYAFQKHL